MARLRLDNISKTYPDGTLAVAPLNLDIADEEFLILAGPSGCGKSTTLRMIAGLETPTTGEMYLDDERVTSRAPGERDIAMVFQNYGLYPHMTAYDNMAFPLAMRSMSKSESDTRVREVADLLGISDVLTRKPDALSGGQKQRVAMGRAIVREPKIFLMDEPLSNLDPSLRGELRALIARLHARLGTTFIYVTHDQTEAMTLGSRIIVMNKGEIQQDDTPRAVYEHPANTFVAGFIGAPAMNILEAHIGKEHVRIGDISLPIDSSMRARFTHAGLKDTVLVGIRPDSVALQRDSVPAMQEVTAGVCELLGSTSLIYCEGEGYSVRAVSALRDVKRGEKIFIAFDTDALHFFHPQTTLAL